ncbi:MAG: cation transporter [Clostridia bacterium]|nr:cation transporter [Clostridia bacterium]
MASFLDKIFIKDHDKPHLPEVRERYGLFSSVLGIVVNVFIATAKLVLGLVVGSIAILADAVNNFSDAGASIVSFVSFKIAAKPADRDHPFGHARIEYVCSMIVSFLILLVGVELMTESFGGFFESREQSSDIPLMMYVILGGSIVLKLMLAMYNRRVGKLIKSGVLEASSQDSIMDALSTSAVLISGVVIRVTGLWFIDSIVGVCVSVMILIAGLRILNDTKNSLLGEAPLEEMINNIRSVVAKYEDIVGIHDLLVHNYGPDHYFASMHAEVDGSKDIYMLHDMIDNLEREIKDSLGILCTIHMDPIETNNEDVRALREMTSEVVARLYDGADIHDFRTVIGHTHTNLIFDIEMPFEVKDSTDTIIKNVESELKKIDEKYFIVVTIDRQ